jgi:hypothetical protein
MPYNNDADGMAARLLQHGGISFTIVEDKSAGYTAHNKINSRAKRDAKGG